MKRERDPTPEEFQKLLAWLDPDSSKAGTSYNLLKTRLIRIFVSRGCVDAEMLADEVMNRVAVRIDTVKTKFPGPVPCCLGFADNVYHEYLRDQIKQAQFKPPEPPRPADELEKEDECLRKCLGELDQHQRNLIERYFHQDEKGTRKENRKKLAQELKLVANALRIQAFRVRKTVRGCLRDCLAN